MNFTLTPFCLLNILNYVNVFKWFCVKVLSALVTHYLFYKFGQVGGVFIAGLRKWCSSLKPGRLSGLYSGALTATSVTTLLMLHPKDQIDRYTFPGTCEAAC